MIKPLSRMGTWQTYSIDEGLPSLRIEHIAEDSAGYLWFATRDNGASRFDGDEFQTFTQQDGLCSNQVFFIHRDRQERLWFATINGVCWYDGTSFHPLEADGISGRCVTFLYEDRQGRIWCGGVSTLGYYDGTAFHDLIPLYLQHYQQPPSPQWPNRCRGIVQDLAGHLWFGFDYLIRFDGESFHRYEEKEGFPRAHISYVLGQGHTDKVWIGLPRNRDILHYYAHGAFQSIQVDLVGGLLKIQCDREGRGWFCTSQGVLYQDGDGFSRFALIDGLPHPIVKAVFHDLEDRFWFATWGGGIGVYDAHGISVFDLSAQRPENVGEISQIVQDRRGDIWIGYESSYLYPNRNSVVRLDGDHFVFVETEQGDDIGNCFTIYEDLDGDLWFGGYRGLFRYDGQKLKAVEPIAGLTGKSISAIAQDREGQFLFGYWENDRRSVKRLYTNPLKIVYQQGEQFQTIFMEDDKKTPYSRIGTVIATRNDEIYFHLTSSDHLASGAGLARWHPDEGLTFYGIADGLIDDNITDLLLDRDENLWIATANGLSHFDGSTFRPFTTEDGLPNNRIYCLFEDSRGHLWLGTHSGVVHYDGRLFQTIKSPHIGLVCRILEDRDGTFWFGTIMGSIIRYRPRQTPPRIRLIRVTTDQVYEDVADVCSSTVRQPVVFEYKGLSFSTYPRDMLYVYRLQGYNADWCPATRELRACYQNLPPGDYTFQVRAIDRDLNYSEPAQAQLAVKPDAHIESLSAALNRGNKVVVPSEALRQLQTKLTEVAPTDLTVLIGQSEALRQLQTKLTEVAPTDLTVLLLGETGVGKGLAARALHALSAYGNGPFIHVNCGALSQELGDSELFGREDEIATSQVGKVEQAQDGTLFLDEIGAMTLEMQDKVLRLLAERTFERVGSDQTLTAQTRMVAATSRDLKTMVQAGDFREDLYLRLQIFPLYIPPLREHKEDIPALVEFCKNRVAAYLSRQPVSLSSEVMEILQAYDWPGNVRELEHFIQRAIIACKGSQIEMVDLMQYGFDIVNAVLGLKGQASFVPQHEIVPLLEFERRYILEVLNATNWQVKGKKGAAALLGVPSSTLFSKMSKLGIKRS
ncbi:MAG: sigma 54-interacting transcriptional regulator [Gemmatimonadota bacterium]|nr:sigma 54-interacting transcriptional regulator [Gemmatimonadota bacterium]